MRAFLVVLLVFGVFTPWVQAACPNMCSGHGDCKSPDNICTCWHGFMGGDCSLRTCPVGTAWADKATDTDVGHQLAECSNNGICDRSSGKCTCREGFDGLSCNRSAFVKVEVFNFFSTVTCPTDLCNGHGSCESMRYYATFYEPLLPSDPLTKVYEDIWDADMIYSCNCDSGFKGYDCSLRNCPTGDDPLTPGQKNELQLLRCRASAGSFTLTFRGYTTEPINYNDLRETVQAKLNALPTISAVAVSYTHATHTALCYNDIADYNVAKIEFTHDFGDLPALSININTDLLENPEPVEIQQNGGVIGSATSVTGTKEDFDCSGRGTCDDVSGVCSCYEQYMTSDGYGAVGIRGDCGKVIDGEVVSGCPGEIACSGHGYCSGHPTYQCQCSAGWMGGSCEKRTCPYGKSWFDFPLSDNRAHQLAECSNMGNCDRVSGKCTCRAGYEGSACQRLECPKYNDMACAGHGSCLVMGQLAQFHSVNGEIFPQTYGTTPNNPHTWDWNMIQGCHCDYGYEGYDCSLRSCPTGDDVFTEFVSRNPNVPQVDEVQVIECSLTEGSFTLTFRNETSPEIAWDATADEMKAALESMDRLHTVDIEITEPSVDPYVCHAAAEVIITFLTEHGNLPPLVPSTPDVVVYHGDDSGHASSRDGTKEDVLCNNRGVCDHETGLCNCFTGFGSSNGQGQFGDLGDCGHILPYVSVTSET